jgi:hypothetical protein
LCTIREQSKVTGHGIGQITNSQSTTILAIAALSTNMFNESATFDRREFKRFLGQVFNLGQKAQYIARFTESFCFISSAFAYFLVRWLVMPFFAWLACPLNAVIFFV